MLHFCLLLALFSARAAVVHYEFVVEEWVVDFKRPTLNLKRPSERLSPFKIPDENRKGAILVNGQYPGPTIDVFENDTVVINVINRMISEATSLHWHGIHPVDTPWTDGAVGVTQGPILPGQNFTYEFRAWPAGTHYWHSHMDGMQSAKGLRGPFIVRKLQDPFRDMYSAEQVVVLADEWRDPEVCLKLEGAMPGNDVCSDIDYASINGQVATGDLQKFEKNYPYPLIEVEKGTCYRLRFIMMASNAENYIVKIAGHNMTLISMDGVDVKPIAVNKINMHIGERYDVVICADQDPGYYQMELMYDYACTLTPGNFIPPGFHPVSSCKFYGFLHYAHQQEFLHYRAPTTPQGTGGGASPKPVFGEPFDLTNAGDWKKTHPLDIWVEPEEPDVRYVVTLGLQGPVYSKPTDTPLSTGRWYMDIDGRRQTWRKPDSPLLFTKGQCGADRVPVLDIPENSTLVEVVINNLSPTAHNIHLHGMLFQVINVADFQWCNINKTQCFLMPDFANPCPAENRDKGDNVHKGLYEELYWGCKYNAKTDKKSQMLEAPLRKDSFQVWQRSWAVIRFRADAPGMWQFHCHMEQHIALGMVMALNVLPSKQKPIPANVPRDGSCPAWFDPPKGPSPAEEKLMKENLALQQKVKDLEAMINDCK